MKLQRLCRVLSVIKFVCWKRKPQMHYLNSFQHSSVVPNLNSPLSKSKSIPSSGTEVDNKEYNNSMKAMPNILHWTVGFLLWVVWQISVPILYQWGPHWQGIVSCKSSSRAACNLLSCEGATSAAEHADKLLAKRASSIWTVYSKYGDNDVILSIVIFWLN